MWKKVVAYTVRVREHYSHGVGKNRRTGHRYVNRYCNWLIF